MLLKSVQVPRPKTTKIQKRNGVSYVYQVIESTYNKDKKYNVDKRRLLGRMVDDEMMIPNEYFSQYYPDITIDKEFPKFSNTLSVGSFMLIQKIMKDLELERLLNEIFGDNATFIEDIVSYILTNESCTFQYYQNFMRSHPILDNLNDDTQISRLLSQEISEQQIDLFIKCWNQLNKNDESFIYLTYDSTNFNTHAEGVELASYGHPKVDEGLPQVNLSYAVKQENSTPLYYELYDGSVVDNSQLEIDRKNAEKYGYKNIGFIIDRGYVSRKNIGALINNGFAYIIMLKTNQKKCRQLINEHGKEIKELEGYYLPGHALYGTTVPDELFGKKAYYHIFYDDIRASQEKAATLETYAAWEKEMDKKIASKEAVHIKEMNKYKKAFNFELYGENYVRSYTRNTQYISNELDNLGFFIIASSRELTTNEALDIYRSRDNIEKLFRSIKSGIDFNKARVHSTQSFKCKFFLTFIAMIVRNEIFQRTKELRQKNRKYYTVPGIISELEILECTRNSIDKYERDAVITNRQKQILKLFDINDKYVDRYIRSINL